MPAIDDAPLSAHEAAMRAFLKDHPEHLVGVRRVTARMAVPGRDLEDLLMDLDTLIAFVDWTIRTGRGDTMMATRFREDLRKRFGK